MSSSEPWRHGDGYTWGRGNRQVRRGGQHGVRSVDPATGRAIVWENGTPAESVRDGGVRRRHAAGVHHPTAPDPDPEMESPSFAEQERANNAKLLATQDPWHSARVSQALRARWMMMDDAQTRDVSRWLGAAQGGEVMHAPGSRTRRHRHQGAGQGMLRDSERSTVLYHLVLPK
ncbi:hypothetical protein ACCO45_005341 [Purpureocillium lilacinum]|uniref:Uncharacterized protein n=1 Tax=Purpureocillium lilacinum TaxID=33203 RepID=A0ACC4DXG0_PURLI